MFAILWQIFIAIEGALVSQFANDLLTKEKNNDKEIKSIDAGSKGNSKADI
jgi:hypothetical protein